MKKLYAGVAAAALVATGMACSAGSAGAADPWPTGFAPQRTVATANGTLFVFGWDDDGSAIMRVSDGVASVLNLGTDAAPTDIAVHDNTVYAVGSTSDEDDTPTLWTIDATGEASSQDLPATAEGVQTVAVSPDGTELAVAGWSSAAVYALGTLSDNSSPAAIASTQELSGVGSVAFDATGDTFEWTGTAGDGSVSLWSLAADADDQPASSVQLGATDAGSYPTGLVVAADGTSYVTTVNGDAALYAVKDGAVTGSQPVSGATSLVLSADGSIAYVADFGGINAFATDALGTYGDNPNGDYTAPGDDTQTNALTLDGGVLTGVETSDDGSAPLIDQIAAPSAPSNVTAQRDDETSGSVSFAASATTGSSAHPTDAADLLTYTITLHDTTDPSRKDIVSSNWSETDDLTVGDEAPLVAADAYTVTVTATNGLFTSTAATGTLAAYSAPSTGQQPSQQPSPQPSAPSQVSSVKVAPVKASSKKLTLTLAGVSTVPGKVKVYDGKKLIGAATVKDGKVVLKLKKKLTKGKHKVTVKYAGSTQVNAFSKTVKVKVK